MLVTRKGNSLCSSERADYRIIHGSTKETTETEQHGKAVLTDPRCKLKFNAYPDTAVIQLLIFLI